MSVRLADGNGKTIHTVFVICAFVFVCGRQGVREREREKERERQRERGGGVYIGCIANIRK